MLTIPNHCLLSLTMLEKAESKLARSTSGESNSSTSPFPRTNILSKSMIVCKR